MFQQVFTLHNWYAKKPVSQYVFKWYTLHHEWLSPSSKLHIGRVTKTEYICRLPGGTVGRGIFVYISVCVCVCMRVYGVANLFGFLISFNYKKDSKSRDTREGCNSNVQTIFQANRCWDGGFLWVSVQTNAPRYLLSMVLEYFNAEKFDVIGIIINSVFLFILE